MPEEIDEKILLRSLEQSQILGASETRDVRQFGPFLALLSPHEDLIYLNYAMVIGEPDETSLKHLIAHFRERGRTPRFEYFPELWPGLMPLLIEHGFQPEMEVPCMSLAQREFRDDNGARVEMASSIDQLRKVASCLSLAFGQSTAPTEESLRSSLDGIASGANRCAFLQEKGQVVAAGWLIGKGDYAELAGVGTLPDKRRKGFASWVSRHLCSTHFSSGGQTVWLTAGSAEAESVYAKLGFARVGTQSSWAMPNK